MAEEIEPSEAYLGADPPARLTQVQSSAPKRRSGYQSENLDANRTYIESLMASGRRPFRFRYNSGGQAGTQVEAVPLRMINERTFLGLDLSTRTPRSFSIDRLETLSEDEPREDPFRVGDPATIAQGEEYRRNRRKTKQPAPQEPEPGIEFTPDRRP